MDKKTHLQYIFKITLFLFTLFLSVNSYAQRFPVQVTQNILPPYSTKLNDYATSSAVKLRLNLLLTDVVANNKQVRLKLRIQGNGLDIRSVDFVAGATPIFLNGGVLQQLTNIELASYFQPNNLIGITPQQYNKPLPEGLYTFCWEVYDTFTNQQLNHPTAGCTNVYLLLNDPPFLNLPYKGDQIVAQDPMNIIFQWTPRHTNATNVSYEFELRELWDTQIDPQAAFLASPNYYNETTYSTTLLYNIGKPTLLPNKTYAWRVKAKSTTGVSENSVFKNDGYSEIYYFTHSTACYAPTFALSESLGKDRVKITWQGVPDHKKYHVQYKRADIADAEWFEVYTYNNQAQISNLRAGKTYTFRVGGSCNELNDFNPLYSYSTTNQFTMPSKDEIGSSYTCGIVPEIQINNTNPLQNIGVNETFTAGDFPVTVKQVEGGNGSFTGVGYIVVPYLGDTKIAVTFEAISINTDYQLTDGVVRTTYDPTWGDVEDTNDLTQGGVGNSEAHTVNFVVADVQIDPNGDILVIGENGEVVEYAGGEDTVITDSNGQVWSVDEEGNVSNQGSQAEGGASTPKNTNGVNNQGQATAITAKGVTITFSEDSDNKYGFDGYNKKYKATKNLYKKLGDDYYIPYKAVAKGNTETIIANLYITDAKIKPQDIIFKTKDGIAITKIDSTATSYTLQLKGFLTDAELETQALVKQKDKYEVAGAFIQYQAVLKNVNVVLVNTDNSNTNKVKEALKNIYNQAMVNLTITEINDFKDHLEALTPNSIIQSGESGFAAQYTEQQRTINNKLKQHSKYKQDAYYLILTDKQPSSANEKGFMPLGRQFGYIYTKNRGDAITAAHELGHGAFQLKHPFSKHSYKYAEKATNWLMDIKGDVKLPLVHWQAIHNPKLRVGIFDGDQENEYKNGDLISKIIQEIKCQYKSGKDYKIDDKLKSYIKRIIGKNKQSNLYSLTFLRYKEGVPVLKKVNISIGKRNSLSTLKKIPTVKEIENVVLGKIHEYDLGDVFIWSNFDKKLNKSAKESEFLRYITGDYVLISQEKIPNNKVEGDYKTEQLDEIIISGTTINSFIENTLLKDNSMSNKDFRIIKSIASCESSYLSLDTRFKVIQLVSKEMWVEETKEDLVLDFLRTTPGNDYDEILNRFKESPEVYESFAKGVDDFSLFNGKEDNYSRLYDELFLIWSGSTYYKDDEYHPQDGNTYNEKIRNQEFYREVKREIESFILGKSDCLIKMNTVDTDYTERIKIKEILNCLKVLSNSQVQKITYDNRISIIKKLLVTGVRSGTLTNDFEEPLIRLIKYVPADFNSQDFIDYIVDTPIKVIEGQHGGIKKIAVIRLLFDHINDSNFMFSGNNRTELMEAFIYLKARSSNIEKSVKELQKGIDNLDIDALKEKLAYYKYDYRNILRRVISSIPINGVIANIDTHLSLDTTLDDNKGSSPTVLTIEQNLKGGVYPATNLLKREHHPFDLILFTNISKQPLLSDYSKVGKDGKYSAALVPAIIAHYASGVGNDQTKTDLIQTAVDVGALVIPGGQLKGIGKVFYYADKLSSLTSLAGTYNREKDPELSALLNKISLATGLLSMGDLVKGGFKKLLKEKATKIKELTPTKLAISLEEQAEDIIKIIEHHPEELVRLQDSGSDNIKIIAGIIENEKAALIDVLDATKKNKIEKAIKGLRKFSVATGKVFDLTKTYRGVNFKAFIKGSYKLDTYSLVQQQDVFKLWVKADTPEGAGALFDYMKKNKINLDGDGVTPWPPYNGFLSKPDVLRFDDYPTNLTFDRFQGVYKGESVMELRGGFASPVPVEKGYYNFSLENPYTYGSRALLDNVVDNTVYIKFKLLKTDNISFKIGESLPWKTRNGKVIKGNAKQIQSNINLGDLEEDIDYIIMQRSVFKNNKWVDDIPDKTMKDLSKKIDDLLKNTKFCKK
ncbi:hypothetical protein [Tenacibaculum ovolyticum]|uniref:hypothetical protein n=1 Tax=Tenacibaculum ovolyticum TaxID=104270 RepID=UPI003BAB55DA